MDTFTSPKDYIYIILDTSNSSYSIKDLFFLYCANER